MIAFHGYETEEDLNSGNMEVIYARVIRKYLREGSFNNGYGLRELADKISDEMLLMDLKSIFFNYMINRKNWIEVWEAFLGLHYLYDTGNPGASQNTHYDHLSKNERLHVPFSVISSEQMKKISAPFNVYAYFRLNFLHSSIYSHYSKYDGFDDQVIRDDAEFLARQVYECQNEREIIQKLDECFSGPFGNDKRINISHIGRHLFTYIGESEEAELLLKNIESGNRSK
ncbi:MAG: hypothetical protein AB7W47_14245 [Calditrichaceae bacterium]